MKEVVIVSAARTPFGKFGGLLRDSSTVDLGAHVLKGTLDRINLDYKEVDEVYFGVNMPSENRSIARQIALKAGLPETTPAATTDRACCSSAIAIGIGYRSIKGGDIDVAVGGGSENLSATPYFLSELRWGNRIGSITLNDIIQVSCPYTGERRAWQAGTDAVKYGVSREDQDKWALRSQQLYAKALAEGKFKDEIILFEIPIMKRGKQVDMIIMSEDEGPRPDTTLEKLSKLSTVYDSPTVTPGNAPGLSTGAASVILMSKEKANELNIKPLATIVAHAMAAGHPRGIATIPGITSLKALEKAKMTIDQIDLVEINEAFAVMPLVSAIIMGNNDSKKIEEIKNKTNVNGGAIAIGHPTGASAARILMTLIYELKRRGGGCGLSTICGGIGQGESFIVKVN